MGREETLWRQRPGAVPIEIGRSLTRRWEGTRLASDPDEMEERSPDSWLARGRRSATGLVRRVPRRLRWPALLVVAVLLALVAVDVLVDRKLGPWVERRLNQRLHGYTTTVGEVDFNPWIFSLELRRMTVAQDAHPEPPVLWLPRVNLNVQWRALVFGKVVGDALLEEPSIHVNLIQLREEYHDETDLDDRGWQEAALAIYPLRINEIEIRDGALIYIDDDPGRPLELRRVELLARNIRNIRSAERTYPSPVEGSAVVFDHGLASVGGHADFLAAPFPGVQLELELADVALDRLGPIVRDFDVELTAGRLNASGALEYSPWHRSLDLRQVLIDGVRVDWRLGGRSADEAVEAVETLHTEEAMEVRLERLELSDSEMGVVMAGAEEPYRLFLAGADVVFEGYSNRDEGPPTKLDVRGLFQGSGPTRIDGVFRSQGEFDLDVTIEDTELSSLNEMLDAKFNVDVTRGRFAFYSEIRAHGGMLEGYVKPMFIDAEIYDPRQDRDDGFFRRIWERIAELMAKLLENKRRDQVATVADVSGSLEDVRASNLQIVFNLIRNAFIEAILPGFRRDVDEGRIATAKRSPETRRGG